MDSYIKDKDIFYTFLKKFIADNSKVNDSYREIYTEIVEELYPALKDIGQPIKLNLPAQQAFTDSQLELLCFIHYRLKYDTTPVDESARFIFLQEATKRMEKYTHE